MRRNPTGSAATRSSVTRSARSSGSHGAETVIVRSSGICSVSMIDCRTHSLTATTTRALRTERGTENARKRRLTAENPAGNCNGCRSCTVTADGIEPIAGTRPPR